MAELKKFVTDYQTTDLFGFGEVESQDAFFKKDAAIGNAGAMDHCRRKRKL